MPSRKFTALLPTLALTVACGGSRESRSGDTTDGARPVAPADGGMAGMPGMGEAASGAGGESVRLIADMTAALRALDGASADSLRRALPAHRQHLANMIAEMNREMRDMSMATDIVWVATVDSLRQDLTRMPELSPGELETVMPAHRQRVDRLMTSHLEMLRQMGR